MRVHVGGYNFLLPLDQRIPLANDPGLRVPPTFTIEAINDTDRDQRPDLRIECEARDGEVRVQSVTIHARNGRGVLVTDLRAVRLDDWITAAIAYVALPVKVDDNGNMSAEGHITPSPEAFDRAERAYTGRKGRPARPNKHERLAEVARIYRQQLNSRPVDAVAAYLGGITHRSAQKWISQARTTVNPQTGETYLGPAEHGKASG